MYFEVLFYSIENELNEFFVRDKYGKSNFKHF